MEKAVSGRRTARRLFKNPLLLLAGLGIAWLLVLCGVGENGLTTLMRQRRTIKELEGQIGVLEKTNASLKEEIMRLEKDEATIEAFAREELLMVRPHEKVFVFSQSEKTKHPASPE